LMNICNSICDQS